MKTELFISLIFGHLLSDFVLQSSKQVKNKNNINTLAYHALTVASVNCFLIWRITPIWIPVVLFLSHFLVDFTKQKINKKNNKFPFYIFLIDQIIHLAILYLLAFFFIPNYPKDILWKTIFGPNYFSVLILLSGFICATYVLSTLIPLILNPFKRGLQNKSDKESTNSGGFDDGGKLIGILERSFIFILLLINEPSGIGFLITAKTLFRFGEITKDNNRAEVEYIIIGTFASFVLAMILSLITFWIVSQYSSAFVFEIITK